jgi:hypothetical protein
MSEKDPRTDKSTDGPKFEPPDNSKPSPAPGGVGTGTKGDPAKSAPAGTKTGDVAPPTNPVPPSAPSSSNR